MRVVGEMRKRRLETMEFHQQEGKKNLAN